MIFLLAVSVLAYSADALLFPNNNGQGEPEPELLFVCPPPSAPQFGSIKCDYTLLDMKCTAHCNPGFGFETGERSVMVSCDLIEGGRTDTVPKCVRTDTGVVTTEPVTAVPPSTSGNCIRSMGDCFNRVPGDYAYCDNCRMFATCAASGFYLRQCPHMLVFDAANDRCTDRISYNCQLS